MQFVQIVAIFLGSGVGGALRYIIASKLNLVSPFPFGTLLINILACFIIGIVAAYNPLKISDLTKKTLMAGFCGGFSTFSAFANENYHLFQNNKPFVAILYVILTNVLCITATFAGYFLAKPQINIY